LNRTDPVSGSAWGAAHPGRDGGLRLARSLLRPRQATRVIALSAEAFGLGTVAGFAVGGALAQYASWPWIFATGAMLIAAGSGLVMLFVPPTSERACGGFDRSMTSIGASTPEAISAYGSAATWARGTITRPLFT
jgi:MFS family permease